MATVLTRADSFTSNKRKQEYFSDFLDSFAMTPIGNQLGRVVNEQSVNQSLRNLIKTNIGERFFRTDIGGNIYATLFQPNSPPIINALKYYIQRTITENERRVHLIEVQVNSLVISDTEYNTVFDENSIDVTIVYLLINNPDPITLNFILKKVR